MHDPGEWKTSHGYPNEARQDLGDVSTFRATLSHLLHRHCEVSDCTQSKEAHQIICKYYPYKWQIMSTFPLFIGWAGPRTFLLFQMLINI